MTMWAARYTNDWSRDRSRGYSFAEWGLAPFASKVECEAEWYNHEARYCRELHGWLPTLPGLSAAGTGETAEEAIEAAESTSYSDQPYRLLAVFPAVHVGRGSDGEECVRVTGKARIIRRK